MSEVHGTCDDRYSRLRRLFQQNIETGDDLGASIAVVRDGIPVVDLWGGWFDVERSTPWVEDTITATFSVTKTMTALAALVLVDRGELDVYSLWPVTGQSLQRMAKRTLTCAICCRTRPDARRWCRDSPRRCPAPTKGACAANSDVDRSQS